MAKGINANDLNDTLANNIDNIIYYKCDEFWKKNLQQYFAMQCSN